MKFHSFCHNSDYSATLADAHPLVGRLPLGAEGYDDFIQKYCGRMPSMRILGFTLFGKCVSLEHLAICVNDRASPRECFPTCVNASVVGGPMQQ